jgi:hypothetical protein
MSWQAISQQDCLLVQNEQQIMMAGSWLLGLLGLLAAASLAVLVGDRMAAQARMAARSASRQALRLMTALFWDLGEHPGR